MTVMENPKYSPFSLYCKSSLHRQAFNKKRALDNYWGF